MSLFLFSCSTNPFRAADSIRATWFVCFPLRNNERRRHSSLLRLIVWQIPSKSVGCRKFIVLSCYLLMFLLLQNYKLIWSRMAIHSSKVTLESCAYTSASSVFTFANTISTDAIFAFVSMMNVWRKENNTQIFDEFLLSHISSTALSSYISFGVNLSPAFTHFCCTHIDSERVVPPVEIKRLQLSHRNGSCEDSSIRL